jgi:acyl-CoA thioesterase YciA
VKIETWARSPGGDDSEKVTDGIFTFVAVDEAGKPRRIEEKPA